MKKSPRRLVAGGIAAGGILASLLATPCVALAEESAVGADILIP